MKTQQQDCYAAESMTDRGPHFDSVEAVQRFVDGLRDEPWWTAQGFHLKVLRIEIRPSRATRFAGQAHYNADAQAGGIDLTKTGLRMGTVLHEVAHVIAAAKYGSRSHDPWWAKTYLTLVSFVMGGDAYLTLQRAFDTTGVDYDADTTTRPGVIAL